MTHTYNEDEHDIQSSILIAIVLAAAFVGLAIGLAAMVMG